VPSSHSILPAFAIFQLKIAIMTSNTHESISEHGIPIVPSPWSLKATIYMVAWYIPSSQVLPHFAYAPLESASHVFTSGKSCGGMGSIQIIRYSESPVGPYDEMVLCPGNIEWEQADAGKISVKKNLRVSRIYVSQKATCYNGRLHWNIPKHLAKFSFTSPSLGTTKVEVFPHDTSNDPLGATPSHKAFFTATFSPIVCLPYFPFSTRVGRYAGLDFTLVQPPLPEGKSQGGELPGTKKWCKLLPLEYSRKACLGWWDMRQAKARSNDGTNSDGQSTDEEEPREGAYSDFDNWWPGLSRWKIGIKMEDATVDFGGEVYWD